MNAVGIDVSSRKSTVAVLRPLGEVVCLPFDVTHDIAGLASLAEKLKALDGETRNIQGVTMKRLQKRCTKQDFLSALLIRFSSRSTVLILCAA